MSDSLSQRRQEDLVAPGLGTWLTRIVILCSIATVLVLVGDHMLTGGLGLAAIGRQSMTWFAESKLAVVATVAVSIQQSVGTVSARTFEVVSLVVLGLSLLVGGRALTRTSRARQPVQDTVPHAIGPTVVASVSRPPHEPVFARLPQSGAR
jgi:hypothetical protein